MRLSGTCSQILGVINVNNQKCVIENKILDGISKVPLYIDSHLHLSKNWNQNSQLSQYHRKSPGFDWLFQVSRFTKLFCFFCHLIQNNLWLKTFYPFSKEYSSKTLNYLKVPLRHCRIWIHQIEHHGIQFGNCFDTSVVTIYLISIISK